MSATHASKGLFQGERFLVSHGLLGLAESVFVLGLIAVRGARVPPEGDLWKVFEAYAALGLFTITSAAILPLAGLGRVTAWLWRAGMALLVGYSYVFELSAHWRGLDPRLSDFWNAGQHAQSVLYFLSSQGYIALYLVLAAAFLRRPVAGRPLLTSAIRHGLVSTFFGFAAGWWMLGSYQGRLLGEAANIVTLHAFGFHGLQATLLAAWLHERAGRTDAGRWVRAAGWAWNAGNVALAAHIHADRGPLEASPALAMVVVAALVAAASSAVAAWDLLCARERACPTRPLVTR